MRVDDIGGGGARGNWRGGLIPVHEPMLIWDWGAVFVHERVVVKAQAAEDVLACFSLNFLTSAISSELLMHGHRHGPHRRVRV